MTQSMTIVIQKSIVTERDENLNKKIDPHDMNDVGFLAVAIPYCNAVVTDNYWADIAKRKKLDKKYNTLILDDLLDLRQIL